MKRLWLGISCLAASWLFGLEYYFPRDWLGWGVCLGAGVLLIVLSDFQGHKETGPEADETGVASPSAGRPGLWPLLLALFLAPAIVVAPWPYRMAPLLMVAGLVLSLAGKRWKNPASAILLSGLVLLAQALVLTLYAWQTARSHELCWPFPQWIAALARLIGISASYDGVNIALPTMRENHQLGATWELFLDPATVCFIAGAVVAAVLLQLARANDLDRRTAGKPNRRKGPEARDRSTSRLKQSWQDCTEQPAASLAIWLFVSLAIWLPIRAVVLMAVLLHRALRTEYDSPLVLMNLFWYGWSLGLLLLPLALLLTFFLRRRLELQPGRLAGFLLHPGGLKPGWPPIAAAAGAAMLMTIGVFWDPIGARMGGRVAVDEFHSTWEPTERPYDTKWYGHDSGYNYACIYDYCSRFFEMSRIKEPFTDALLDKLDVLVLKVPTSPYAPEEIDAIMRFVDRGGGLLLIGEHTDVFSTGYYINAVARRFGFAFRYDCLFGIKTFFDQHYRPSAVPHPSLHYIPNMDFAVSCSIDPGKSRGRGIVISTGLKNSMADYHASNFYPQPVDHAAMRYGAFVQIWGTRHGRGRVLGFSDSTIFSNFSTFEPGKAELMLGMVEWLNHRDRIGNPRAVLFTAAFILLAGTWYLLRQRFRFLLPAIIGGTLGWAGTVAALPRLQLKAMPLPPLRSPCVMIAIDRTACDTTLSKAGFIMGKTDGFGIFERWILRLGYFTRRDSGQGTFDSDAVVFTYPRLPVDSKYVRGLETYVEDGGHLLIVDSPKNTNSTAAALLEPFGLSQKPLAGVKGNLTGPAGWPEVPVDSAHEIGGGQPLFRLSGHPVGAVARRGKGTVTLIGFGSRFCDAQMGNTGDVEPNADLQKVFDLQFALVRAMVEGRLEEIASTNLPPAQITTTGIPTNAPAPRASTPGVSTNLPPAK